MGNFFYFWVWEWKSFSNPFSHSDSEIKALFSILSFLSPYLLWFLLFLLVSFLFFFCPEHFSPWYAPVHIFFQIIWSFRRPKRAWLSHACWLFSDILGIKNIDLLQRLRHFSVRMEMWKWYLYWNWQSSPLNTNTK